MNSRERIPIDVACVPVSRASAYVPLLFTGIEDRYRPRYCEDGSLREALAALHAGRDAIVHVHWEEFVLRECATEAAADTAAAAFASAIGRVQALGGAIVWTVHNELPHVIGFHPQFFGLRALLARAADTILVHNRASIEILAAQVDVDRSKIRLLAHPSYLGRHEDGASLRAELALLPELRIQGFGWIRAQKGFEEMIGMLPAEFLRARGLAIRISGEGCEAAKAIARRLERTDVSWDIRHVPAAELPRLLRSALCVVLPYRRVLTSGVALLAMSVGAMLVAVDIPQLRELLPEQSRRFLYPRGDDRAFRQAIDDVLALSANERSAIVAANIATCAELRPEAIASQLAAIYDDVRARRAAAPTRSSSVWRAGGTSAGPA